MAEKTKSTYNPASPAVAQAAQILMFLGNTSGHDPGVSEICNAVGIHKSKGFSILNTLAGCDFVTKDPRTKTYRLGPALIPLGRKAIENCDIAAVARDHLERLAGKTGASVLLGIICNDQFYITAKYDGNQTVSVTIRQYQSLHITHGSHGKSIFAHLDKTEQQRILAAGPVFFHGPSGNVDMERLEAELAFCRENGYAVDNEEITPGIRAVSAPLFDGRNRVFAAMVVLGTFGENQLTRLGEMTSETSRIISRQMGAGI
jgi:IclR family transcriptional regulator, acetate operon repressor